MAARNVNILVIKEVLRWTEQNIEDVVNTESNTPEAYRAFAMICGVLNHQDLKDFGLTTPEIAKYFQVTQMEVLKAINKHIECAFMINNYKLIYKHIMLKVTNHIHQVYELSETNK